MVEEEEEEEEGGNIHDDLRKPNIKKIARTSFLNPKLCKWFNIAMVGYFRV
jgi:hypothetical protein